MGLFKNIQHQARILVRDFNQLATDILFYSVSHKSISNEAKLKRVNNYAGYSDNYKVQDASKYPELWQAKLHTDTKESEAYSLWVTDNKTSGPSAHKLYRYIKFPQRLLAGDEKCSYEDLLHYLSHEKEHFNDSTALLRPLETLKYIASRLISFSFKHSYTTTILGTGIIALGYDAAVLLPEWTDFVTEVIKQVPKTLPNAGNYLLAAAATSPLVNILLNYITEIRCDLAGLDFVNAEHVAKTHERDNHDFSESHPSGKLRAWVLRTAEQHPKLFGIDTRYRVKPDKVAEIVSERTPSGYEKNWILHKFPKSSSTEPQTNER